jgi:hypothetical protein
MLNATLDAIRHINGERLKLYMITVKKRIHNYEQRTNLMNPDDITLDKPSKSFEYEKISRDIEKIEDIALVKNMARCWVKLYLKQQETLSSM